MEICTKRSDNKIEIITYTAVTQAPMGLKAYATHSIGFMFPMNPTC
jgi:hypothetical protein